MARYDLSGIGVNLREIPGDDGNVKLKVLGLLLDGPAHAAGVRQVERTQITDKIKYQTTSLRAVRCFSAIEEPSTLPLRHISTYAIRGPPSHHFKIWGGPGV